MSLVVARLKADPLVTFRVMISSTVEDLVQEREAAERAILGLGLTRLRAEKLGSTPQPPQVICALLAEQCDLFVQILGERYGYIIKSEGISVIEFEYEIARAQNPEKILVYVKDGVHLQRVQDFEQGYFRSLFTSPEDLYEKIQRDIVRWLTSQAKQKHLKEDPS
jgi:hypothetical protein